uniref:transferrin receptor protein 2-like isoform X3 n=1 Tax=Myxine glutinosa TaxID=7769 RepID=UPI00358FB841
MRVPAGHVGWGRASVNMAQFLHQLNTAVAGKLRSYTRYRNTESNELEIDEVYVDSGEHTLEGRDPLSPDRRCCRRRRTSGMPMGPHRNFLCCVATFIAVALTGFGLGCLAFRTRTPKTGMPSCPHPTPTTTRDHSERHSIDDEGKRWDKETRATYEDLADAFSSHWSDSQLTSYLRRIGTGVRLPGSVANHEAAQFVFDSFKRFGLEHVRVDTHYVALPFPDPKKPSEVQLIRDGGRSNVVFTSTEQAFCPYSASGSVEGPLVYAYYGLAGDYDKLAGLGVTLNGSIVLIREGKSSYSEKVWLVQEKGALGVLIYPDPMDRPGLEYDDTISGHVHYGLGDPYSPGFPSLNNTQFPPVQASFLPHIPAMPISQRAAHSLMGATAGQGAPSDWMGSLVGGYQLGGVMADGVVAVRLSVNMHLLPRQLHNVIGILPGTMEPDRYVLMGARRDSLGSPGVARSAAGTASLLQLARIIGNITQNGLRLRRSLIFMSWDGGEFGAVGATEWVEGFLSILRMKAITYVDLDSVALGQDELEVWCSPLLGQMLDGVIRRVHLAREHLKSHVDDWYNITYRRIPDSSAFLPFIAIAGVPSVQFGFTKGYGKVYAMEGSQRDNQDFFQQYELARAHRAATKLAGHVVLKLTASIRLPFNPQAYVTALGSFVQKLTPHTPLLRDLNVNLRSVYSAHGDYSRAVESLTGDIWSPLHPDFTYNRQLNDRLTQMEWHLLSPFVSPSSQSLRHIMFGRGHTTLEALIRSVERLAAPGPQPVPSSYVEEAKLRLALATWTLQSATNSIRGDIWDIHEDF